MEIFTNNGKTYQASVSFLVYDMVKTIVIEDYYPRFPHEKKGRSRAFLRQLWSGPEYAGYKLICNAAEPFRRSFIQMKEFSPMVAEGAKSLFEEAGKEAAEELDNEEMLIKNVNMLEAIEVLKADWLYANLYGIVPEVANQAGVDLNGPSLAKPDKSTIPKTDKIQPLPELSETNSKVFQAINSAA